MLNEIKLSNTNWPYAKLNVLAKKMGGPEAMLQAVQNSGRPFGRKEMIPAVVGAFVIGGSVASFLTYKVMKCKETKRKEIEANKNILLLSE